MNKKNKALVYIVVFLLLIIAAVFGYNYLTERYKAPNSLGWPSDVNSQMPSDNTQSPTPSSPGGEEEEKPPEKEPVAALDFTVQDYDGNEVKLSDYIGTPIVLNFWASWCPPCRAEMPHFNMVSEEYPDDELIFLMVDLVDGGRETIEKGKAFIEENGYTFTVLFDTEQNAAATYRISSLPTTYFIDKDGYIAGGARGSIDEETLRYGISLITDE